MQNPCSSDTENRKEVIPHACLTCNQSRWLHQSPKFPQTSIIVFLRCSPDLTTFGDYLWCNLILRSTSGTPDMPCQHLSESAALSHWGGGHASLSWMAKRQRAAAAGCSGGGKESSVDRVELKRSWRMSCPGASAATSVTELEGMNNKQRVDEKQRCCIEDMFVHWRSFTTEPESLYWEHWRSVAIRMIC